MADSVVISLTVVTEDPPAVIPRVAEAFARVAAGFALEGITIILSFGTVKEDE